jgi:hypothetical protein
LQIPVVLESSMRAQTEWDGPVGIFLGNRLFLDCCDDGEYTRERLVDQLVQRISEIKISITPSVPALPLASEFNADDNVRGSRVFRLPGSPRNEKV